MDQNRPKPEFWIGLFLEPAGKWDVVARWADLWLVLLFFHTQRTISARTETNQGLFYVNPCLKDHWTPFHPLSVTCQWDPFEVLVLSLMDRTYKVKLFFPPVPFSISLNLQTASNSFFFFSYPFFPLCNSYMTENDLLT